jgi:trigger factor
MQDIRITSSGEEPGARQLTVEIPLERVDAAQNKAARYYAKQVKLPGFRKGKVPQSVIQKKFRDAIRESVLRELIQESWETAVKQENLKPIADPEVKELKFEDGAPITFELVVAVKPELTLGRVGGFELKRKIPKVTDSMVDLQLEEIRRQRAPWVPVEAEKPSKGELVAVTVTPLEEGEAQEGKQYQIVLGEGQALPDVEDRVMQMLPGETTDTTVRFPDDFPDETKRGKLRSVRLELHEVKRQDLPDLTDDFAREVGDFESADSLKDAVRTDLEKEAHREADSYVRRLLLQEVESANNVEAPRPMVQRVISAFAQTYEVPDDQYEKFASDFAPVAEQQVIRDLIIEHLAEREGLKATEEDIDERIDKIAKDRNTEPAKVYSSLQKANRIGELERGITEERVFEYLMEQSTITDEIA